MMFSLLIAFVVAGALSFVLTPWIMRFAHAVGAVDRPNERKVHSGVIPRLGGVAIFGSFLLSLLLYLVLYPDFAHSSWISNGEGLLLLLLLLVVGGLGLGDDIFQLTASRKFLVQLIIANIAYFGGFSITEVTHPFSAELWHLGLFSYPVTILWIIGITNAVNLIDGLDGLASGIATIAFMTIVPISILNGDYASTIVSVLLAGALCGFLHYNFNPARIFLGDCGSLFLGFMLAVISVKSSTKGTAVLSIIAPLLALGLPIMDTLVSMIRRLLGSFLDENSRGTSLLARLKRMFIPDCGHIHHRLIAQGFSQRKAVLILYMVSCVLGTCALAVTVANGLTASLIVLTTGIASFVGIRQLHYREMAILRNGILLPLYDRPVMNRDSLCVFADLSFIVFAYHAARFFTGRFDFFGEQSLPTAAVVVGIQFVVFVVSGIYKRVFRLIGIHDVLGMLKTAALAVGVSAVAYKLLIPMSQTTMTLFLVDYFLLITLTVGFRSSFQILRHFHSAEQRRGKRLLIYGADAGGLFILNSITELNYREINPIGFIDEDPSLEGKRIGGYPVFGGHWRLPRIFRLTPFDEIVICVDSMKDEVVKRVKRFADEHRVRLTSAKVVFADLVTSKHSVAVPRLITQSLRREEEILEYALSDTPETLSEKVGTQKGTDPRNTHPQRYHYDSI